MFRENFCALLSEEQNGIALSIIPLLHAWGPYGHARHGEPGGVRFLQQKTLNIGGGNMPLNDVTIHDSGVTGPHAIGDTILLFDGVEVRRVVYGNVEAGLPHMIDPLGAAAASRRLVDNDLAGFCNDRITFRQRPPRSTTQQKGHKDKGWQAQTECTPI